MAKQYTLSEAEVADDQKTVTISETKSVTEERKVTVAQLKEEHANVLNQIADLGARADTIVDELSAINTNLPAIAIENIPEKVVDDKLTKPSIPKKN